MTYPLCGKCLHSVTAHSEHGIFMYCAKCMQLCDKDEYDIEHKASGSIVQDGQVFQIK